MSVDLTAAVEAAARDWFSRQQAQRMDHGRISDDGNPWSWDDLPPADQRAYLALVQPVVATVAPLIEAAVREQIATSIEAAKSAVDQSIAAPGHYAGLGHAARIARSGGQQP